MSSGAVTSDECSPRHVGRWSVLDRRSSWHEEDMNGRFRNTDDWKTATTRSERLYKDRRGTLHVANQPPGYMDDRDSHPSESTSEHEHHQRRSNDTESHDDGRRGAARPWTSSGSESAYETIRERHRHVDEALASSFEFYSTSPRDARLLGYMSSDAAKDEVTHCMYYICHDLNNLTLSNKTKPSHIPTAFITKRNIILGFLSFLRRQMRQRN